VIDLAMLGNGKLWLLSLVPGGSNGES